LFDQLVITYGKPRFVSETENLENVLKDLKTELDDLDCNL